MSLIAVLSSLGLQAKRYIQHRENEQLSRKAVPVVLQAVEAQYCMCRVLIPAVPVAISVVYEVSSAMLREDQPARDVPRPWGATMHVASAKSSPVGAPGEGHAYHCSIEDVRLSIWSMPHVAATRCPLCVPCMPRESVRTPCHCHCKRIWMHCQLVNSTVHLYVLGSCLQSRKCAGLCIHVFEQCALQRRCRGSTITTASQAVCVAKSFHIYYFRCEPHSF